MIRFDDLQFQFPEGDFRLRVSDLEIATGEKIALVGPSGSGKTTLLDLIAGIRLPGSGRLILDDTNICQLTENQRRKFRIAKMGLVFQEFELLEYLTVSDNIQLPYLINRELRHQKSEVVKRMERLAADVGISDKLKRKPQKLSQGERQRVAICRAMIHHPSFILADEPTGNLDPANKQKILSVLIDQVEQEGATLLVVTHDQNLTGQFDRVIDVNEFGA